MKSVLLAAIIAAIGIRAATSWSDVATGEVASDPPPSDPSYVGSTSRHEPLTPYDPGPAEALWKYSDLRPEEKAHVDRGNNVGGWAEVHEGFNAVIMDEAEKAIANSAEHQLGLQDSGEIGVVP